MNKIIFLIVGLIFFMSTNGHSQSLYENKPIDRSMLEVEQPPVNIKVHKDVANGGTWIGVGGLLLIGTGIYGIVADKEHKNFDRNKQIGLIAAGVSFTTGGLIIGYSTETR